MRGRKGGRGGSLGGVSGVGRRIRGVREGGGGAWVKEGDGRESEENKLNDENFG